MGKGTVVASYLVRVTLHENEEWPEGQEHTPDVPTNERLERIAADALYDNLNYFHMSSITVSSERTDR